MRLPPKSSFAESLAHSLIFPPPPPPHPPTLASSLYKQFSFPRFSPPRLYLFLYISRDLWNSTLLEAASILSCASICPAPPKGGVHTMTLSLSLCFSPYPYIKNFLYYIPLCVARRSFLYFSHSQQINFVDSYVYIFKDFLFFKNKVNFILYIGARGENEWTRKLILIVLASQKSCAFKGRAAWREVRDDGSIYIHTLWNWYMRNSPTYTDSFWLYTCFFEPSIYQHTFHIHHINTKSYSLSLEFRFPNPAAHPST